MDQRCTDCGARDLREIHGDLTCVHCGLVKEAHLLSDCPDWHDFADDIPTSKKCKIIQHTTEHFAFRDEFSTIQNTLQLHDTVIDIAKDILKTWLKKSNTLVKGYDRKIMCAAVAVYYACKNQPGGGRTKEELCCMLGLSTKGFGKVCTSIRTTLSDTIIATGAMTTGTKFQDLINRFISLLHLTSGQTRMIRSTVHKLYDRVKPFETSLCCATHNLVATLIYMASMYLKLNLTMKGVGESCGVSVATIIQYEKMIKEFLMHAPK